MRRKVSWKCQRCPKRIAVKEYVYCLECYLDKIYEDLDDLKKQVILKMEQDKMTRELFNACFNQQSTLSTPLSEKDHEAAQEFYGLDGYAFFDRLDNIMN